jgi:hypothetical protein
VLLSTSTGSLGCMRPTDSRNELFVRLGFQCLEPRLVVRALVGCVFPLSGLSGYIFSKTITIKARAIG